MCCYCDTNLFLNNLSNNEIRKIFGQSKPLHYRSGEKVRLEVSLTDFALVRLVWVPVRYIYLQLWNMYMLVLKYLNTEIIRIGWL